MSSYKIALIAALAASTEARFGQEQVPVAAVVALGTAGFGAPGVADTLAGSIPGSLLAAANPCQKLTIADEIVAQLGNNEQVISAALGLVSAETNFNPFVVNKPFVCNDATLPNTTALRGVVPLVDPAVLGSDLENANSKKSVATPFNAVGLSQAQVMIAQGFSNFTAVDSDGTDVVLAGQGGTAAAAASTAAAANNAAATSVAATSAAAVATSAAVSTNCGGFITVTVTASPVAAAAATTKKCNGKKKTVTVTTSVTASAAEAVVASSSAAAASSAASAAASSAAGSDTAPIDSTGDADFGLCTPTMAFVGGLDNRPATEFTFIPQDPLVAKGQQEALNPNIITNRICDQLTNVCEANDKAKAVCQQAKAEIEALGTRDRSTADTWNALLGFPNANSSVVSI